MFKRSKTIKEIYSETQDFDLVITNDPALATGLNRLVDKPRLGTFALTPRQIAARYGAMTADKIYKQGEIIADIFRRTKIPVRVLHPSVEKIFDIWRNTGLLDSCEMYLSNEDVKLAKIIREYPTLELLMEEFDENFYGAKTIGVLGSELFTLLDLQVLPRKKKYEEIRLFTGQKKSPIKSTYVFPSANDMVNAVVDRINIENQNAVSIVINFNSPYLAVLKSRLKLAGVDIIENISLSQDNLTRDFVRIIGMSFMKHDLLVRDVRQVGDSLGICIPETFNDWSFAYYSEFAKDDPGTLKLSKFIDSLSGKKYSFAVEEFRRVFELNLNEQLSLLLDVLGLSKSVIDEDNYSDLVYYLRYIDVETDKCNDGVLFANSLNSVYINRDIVFYLGMDSGWTKVVGEKEYIDRKEEERKNLDKFQILLSQGEQRFYFAHSVTEGEKTIPCHYFNILADKNIDGFDSEFFKKVLPEIKTYDKFVFETDPGRKRKIAEFRDVSQSGLNKYYACPKRFGFKLLLTEAQNPAMLRGELLHNFAEFCFDYPDYCGKNFEKILKALLRKFDRFGTGGDDAEDESIFRIAMMQIQKFLSELDVQKTEAHSTRTDNFLYAEFRKTKIYGNTEFFFYKVPPGMKGRIDLLGNGVIYDFKTSSRHSPSYYIKKSVLSLLNAGKSTDANFQTAMYLIYALKTIKDVTAPSFCYLFPLEAKADIISKRDAVMSVSLINYIPVSLTEYLSDEEVFNELQNGIKSKLIKRFTLESWVDLIGNIEHELMSGIDQVQEISSKILKLVREEINLDHSDFGYDDEFKFVDKEILPIAKFIRDLRTPRAKPGKIFRSDLEEVEKYIRSALEEMNKLASTVFPARPAFNKRKVCYECDYLVNCTGNKLWEGSSGYSDSDENDEGD